MALLNRAISQNSMLGGPSVQKSTLRRPSFKRSCNTGPCTDAWESLGVSVSPPPPPVIMLLWPTPTPHYLSIISSAFLPPPWPILLSWPLTHVFAFLPVWNPCPNWLQSLKTVLQGGRRMWGSRDNHVTPTELFAACLPASLSLIILRCGLFIKWPQTIRERLVSLMDWLPLNSSIFPIKELMWNGLPSLTSAFCGWCLGMKWQSEYYATVPCTLLIAIRITVTSSWKCFPGAH